MSPLCPSIAICRLRVGTRFRFGTDLQSAAIHGTVEGPGVEGGVLVRFRPRKDHGHMVPGRVTEWSGAMWVEVEDG